jgi:hypothetical protein
MTPEHPTAFISYARESAQQDERVLGFAQSLRGSGIDCMIDQFADPVDWVQWMEEQIRKRQWIMVVATETYLRRANNDEPPDVGLGASWEYADIRNILYGSRRGDPKIVPIVFRPEDKAYIPDALRGRSYYDVSNDATRHRLVLKLAGLPITVEPAPLGEFPRPKAAVALLRAAPFPRTPQPADAPTLRERVAPALRTITVAVKDETSAPVAGAIVTAVAENGTTSGGSTGADGTTNLTLLADVHYTVLAAHDKYEGALRPLTDLISNSTVVLRAKVHGGSVIGVGGTTHIPGLGGRLNPILDTQGRMYLYADNIAINGSALQPAEFQLDQPLELQGAAGSTFMVTVRYIFGRAFLLDYVRRTP